MTKRISVLTLLMLFTVISLNTNATQANGITARNLDEQFGLVADKVPDFGGMFYDENGDLNVYLTDPGQAATAKAALTAVFGTDRLSLPRGMKERAGQPLSRTLPAGEFRVLKGQYGFSQLKRWLNRLLDTIFSQPGVVTLDLDETSNRIKIGVQGIAQHSIAVKAELANQNVPAEAVIIMEASPIEPVTHTLRSLFRPVQGGVQIHFSSSLCTLGFNAYRAGVRGFVTNSHCSDFFGGFDGTTYYQPLSPNQIGQEYADPLFFTGGSCPAGYQCRLSDSLFARYDTATSSSLATIAQPVFGTININHASPTFQIVGTIPFPIVGDALDKVGRTTGWTYGRVAATCVNTLIAGLPNHVMLCQDFVDTTTPGTVIVADGDSGSPVFAWNPTNNNVLLDGILWGRNSTGTTFVFSAMANIQTELGTLTTY